MMRPTLTRGDHPGQEICIGKIGLRLRRLAPTACFVSIFAREARVPLLCSRSTKMWFPSMGADHGAILAVHRLSAHLTR